MKNGASKSLRHLEEEQAAQQPAADDEPAAPPPPLPTVTDHNNDETVEEEEEREEHLREHKVATEPLFDELVEMMYHPDNIGFMMENQLVAGF